MNEGPAWEDPRRTLARHGLRPKRGYSQNFLVARPIVEQIAEAVASRASAGLAVELGPGLGTLTGELLRRGLAVHALEADPDMRRVLEVELDDQAALEVHAGDAAALDLRALRERLGRPFVLCGNLPYAITGAILRRVTDAPASIEAGVFMVQREVQQRLLAPPGDKAYGALTVFTHAVFDVSPVCRVSAGCFHPRPRIDSAVVALTPRIQTRARIDAAFERTVRAAFEARRKTLRNALLRSTEPERVDAALEATAIDGRRRGETLSVEEFDALARVIGRAPEIEI